MTKQEIIDSLRSHLAELTEATFSKSREMKQSLEQKIQQSEHFSRQLVEAQAALAEQISQSKAQLLTLDKPLELEQELTEIAHDDADIAQLQHHFAEKVNQHINQLKADTVTAEQSLNDLLEETKRTLYGKTNRWAHYKQQFDARFGHHIQWAKHKLAAQLVVCADKLKA